jgi:hypothetical protein
VIAPAELVADDPTQVVAMNPVYLDEIRAELTELGLSPELVAV